MNLDEKKIREDVILVSDAGERLENTFSFLNEYTQVRIKKVG